VLDGLMKGDITARYQAYALAVQWGWMTRNEVRARENLNPIAGADEPPEAAQHGEGRRAVERRRPPRPAEAPRRELGVARRAAGDLGRREAPREDRRLRPDRGARVVLREHAEQVARQLHISEHEATRYAADHRDAVLAAGAPAMRDWLVAGAETLTDLAMDQKELAAA
jgi:hypothetical protein